MDTVEHKNDRAKAERWGKELRSKEESVRRQAQREIWEEFHGYFMNIAYERLLPRFEFNVEHVVDNLFLKVFEGKKICEYKGDGSLKNYLTKILIDLIKDEYKKIGRKKNIVNRESISLGEENKTVESETRKSLSTPEEELLEKEQRDLFEMAFEQLKKENPKDYRMLTLRRKDLKYKEISAILNMSEDSVKKRFTRKDSLNIYHKFKVILEELDFEL